MDWQSKRILLAAIRELYEAAVDSFATGNSNLGQLQQADLKLRVARLGDVGKPRKDNPNDEDSNN